MSLPPLLLSNRRDCCCGGGGSGSECLTTFSCSSLQLPVSWIAEVPTVGVDVGYDPENVGTCLGEICNQYAGSYLLSLNTVYSGGVSGDNCGLLDPVMVAGVCGNWGSAVIKGPSGLELISPPESAIPLVDTLVCFEAANVEPLDGQRCFETENNQQPSPLVTLSIEPNNDPYDITTATQIRLVARLVATRIRQSDLSIEQVDGAFYVSAWYDKESFSWAEGVPITLSYSERIGFITVCDWPGSITVSPLTEGTLASMAAGCHSLCSPYLEPVESSILRLQGSIESGTVTACLGAFYNADTLGWEWEGGGVVELGGCHGIEVRFHVYSVYDEETGVCSWFLDISPDGSSISTLPVEITTIDPLVLTSSGSTNVCSGGASAFDLQEFTGYQGPHPFLSCCTPTIAEQCDLKDCFLADGELTGGEGICNTTSSTTLSLVTATAPGSPTGYTDGDAYFFGDFPFDDGMGTYTGWKVMIYCGSGGGMQYAILDSGGNVQKQGALPNWSCASFTGGPIDVTDLIVVSSCYASFPDAQAFINLEPCV